MKTETRRLLKGLIEKYDHVMQVMEHDAAKSMKEDGRAYGGFVRVAKGKIQEFICDELVRIAWDVELGKDAKRLAINSNKIRIPIKPEYVRAIRDREIKDYILSNIQRYHYGLYVDKHVFIDGKMILGIECKAYTKNDLMKQILVDFDLLKTQMPNLLCYLFQLEGNPGGNNTASATALMSYFPNVDLNVITLFNSAKIKPADEYKFPKALTVEKLEKMLAVLVSAFQQARRN